MPYLSSQHTVQPLFLALLPPCVSPLHSVPVPGSPSRAGQAAQNTWVLGTRSVRLSQRLLSSRAG